MYVDLIPLRDWIKSQFSSYPHVSPVTQKEETAVELGVGVATIYRWLKEGNRYVQLVGCEDDTALVVWKMEGMVEA